MKKILLIGNPNVGKTTILNKITNSSFRVGNWSGVTISNQEGLLNIDNISFMITDLPGLYSLNPSTTDESLSVHHLFYEEYDLIVNIVDVYNLHQNLMLTFELLELLSPMVILINFYEEFSKHFSLNIDLLEKECGVPIIPLSLNNSDPYKLFFDTIKQTANYSSWRKRKTMTDSPLYLDIEDKVLAQIPNLAASKNQKIQCIQILLNNRVVIEHNKIPPSIIDNLQKQVPYLPYRDAILETKMRLMQNDCIKQTNKKYKNWEHILDTIFLHPVAGYIVSSMILVTFFNTVFNFSKPYIDLIDWSISNKLKLYISTVLVDIHPTIQSFIIDGLINGIGSVLTFVPLIFCLYLFLSILEESGYLARIAVLLDYPLSKVGLSGKSLFPMMLGFGCTVPAIYGTRVIENPKQRYLTASLSSLLSCGARLPIYALFTAAFFRKSEGLILFSLYLTGILLTMILAFILSKSFLFQKESIDFLMVLPKYRIPNISVIIKTALFYTKGYIKNAGSIILGMLIVMWTISYFPNHGNISTSYLSKIGKIIQPIFVPLGFGDRWETVVSIIPALIAKEASVGFLGQVLSFDNDKTADTTTIGSIQEEMKEISTQILETIQKSIKNIIYMEKEKSKNIPGLVNKTQNIWQDKDQSKKAYSFMLFMLLTLPCVAAIGALRQELPTRYFLFTIMLYTILPFLGSFLYYQIARLF